MREREKVHRSSSSVKAHPFREYVRERERERERKEQVIDCPGGEKVNGLAQETVQVIFNKGVWLPW